MIKKIALLSAAAFGVMAATPSAAVAYLPVGPQTNVALSTVTSGGWTLCYSAGMDVAFGTSASVTLAGCTGSQLMLAGRQTGSSNLMLLAQTLTVDALNPTGADANNVFTTSNGTDWFYNDDWSWGFKTIGNPYYKYQCDGPSAGSMCLHVLNVGGHHIDTVGTWGSDYEKLVFTSDGGGAVPEPASWALLITGFALVGAAARRRRAIATA